MFLVECGRERNLGPTTMSLWGAAVTTMLSFGLLALSSTQALRAIGLTVGIGTALSFLLAPLTLTIMRGEWKEAKRWRCALERPRSTAVLAGRRLRSPSRPAPPPAGSGAADGGRAAAARFDPGTFTLRQKLTATSPKGGGSFEAVLQKQPGTLTLVGLTPYGSRAFLLQQTKGDVSFTKYIPRELPFAPTFLLLDIHRVLATWIGPPLVTGRAFGAGRRRDRSTSAGRTAS